MRGNSDWEPGVGQPSHVKPIPGVSGVLARRPESLAAVWDEVAPARAAEPRLDRAVAAVERDLAEGAGDPDGLQAGSRRLVERLVERLAVLLQGALVVRHGHPAVADAFCTSGSPATTGPPRGTLAPRPRPGHHRRAGHPQGRLRQTVTSPRRRGTVALVVVE